MYEVSAGPDRAKAAAAARSGHQLNLLQIDSEPLTNPPVHPGFPMTTCIDTIEICYPLSQHEAGYIAYRLDAVTHAENEEPRSHFLSTDPDDEDSNVLVYERFYRFIPGITRIKLLKTREKWVIRQTVFRFKIFFWLKPELLVTGQYTLQLFRCSPVNYLALQEAYAEAIYELFPRAFGYAPLDSQLETYPEGFPPSEAYANQNLTRLGYLGLCRIERLDISKNIAVNDAARFEELVRKTYQDNRQLKLKKQSYMLADNTVKTFKAYDKQKELREQHTRSPNLPELLQAADGVIRIEISIKKPDRATLKTLFELDIPAAPKSSPAYLQCGLIPFFFAESSWGDKLMLQLWQEHIGTAPWLSGYFVNQAIDCSRAWPETKKLAKDVSYVISRKRSLNEARTAYVVGVEIYGKKYQGTAEEFDKAVKFLRKIGVQPFRIPRRWKKQSRIEADFRMYPSVHEGFNHLPRNRPGIPSAPAEIYQFIKTKLIEIYKSYKPP